jgi:hypothetical protein
VIPSDQPDFLTAIKFVNSLREVNVAVHRATREFQVGARRYPEGSFVVLTAQAFRPHVLDMFEPQDHPNVIPYPGAPPTPPYDNAGWTLALQMGIQFDRILEPFSGPFEKVTDWNVKPPAGRVTSVARPFEYRFDRRVNDSVIAVNRLIAAGEDVSAAGTSFRVRARPSTLPRLQRLSQELGLDFSAAPAGDSAARPVRRSRIGLWDQYGGSMTSGWTRWILEQFDFPFQVVFPPELDAGGLNARYDVLVFPSGAVPAPRSAGRGGRGGPGPVDADVPAEYRSRLGRITDERTLPQLRQFVENGGTIIAIGDSAAGLAAFLKLPVDEHLQEDGTPLPRAKYFVPGSVLAARVDVTHDAAVGMPDRADFFFDNSPVFRLNKAAPNVRAIAWFDSPTPLRSGWAWGQQYLNGGVVAAEARVGKGRVLLYGPEILQRAQPHGTFKLLFNGILAAGSGAR